MQNPDIIKRLSASGVSVVISKSPADFAAFTARESARFARVIKDAHIPTD